MVTKHLIQCEQVNNKRLLQHVTPTAPKHYVKVIPKEVNLGNENDMGGGGGGFHACVTI